MPMSKTKKLMAVGLAAATLGGTMVASSAPAEAGYYGRGGYHGGYHHGGHYGRHYYGHRRGVNGGGVARALSAAGRNTKTAA